MTWRSVEYTGKSRGIYHVIASEEFRAHNVDGQTACKIGYWTEFSYNMVPCATITENMPTCFYCLIAEHNEYE